MNDTPRGTPTGEPSEAKPTCSYPHCVPEAEAKASKWPETTQQITVYLVLAFIAWLVAGNPGV